MLFVWTQSYILLESSRDSKVRLRNLTNCAKESTFLIFRVLFSEGNSNVQVIYALAILYAQECLQNEAAKILSYVKAGDEAYRKSFVGVVLKFWRFLFDEVLLEV